MTRLRVLRSWACYWLLKATFLFPKRWQRSWPLWDLQAWLLQYGGYWALRQNPKVPREMFED